MPTTTKPKRIKGSRYVKEFNISGECELHLETILKSWNKRFYINQWKDEYALVQEGLIQGAFAPKLNVRISSNDALELIQKRNLICVKSCANKTSEAYELISTWYDVKTIKSKIDELKRLGTMEHHSLPERNFVQEMILRYEEALKSIPKETPVALIGEIEKIDTTGIASKTDDKKFIGFEKDDEYVAVAEKQMNLQLLSKLKEKDHVAFQWNYGSFGKEIVVASITIAEEQKVLVHWMDGYKSEGKWIEKSEIIAIGDNSAKGKIKGYSGKFNILIPNHELLEK